MPSEKLQTWWREIGLDQYDALHMHNYSLTYIHTHTHTYTHTHT